MAWVGGRIRIGLDQDLCHGQFRKGFPQFQQFANYSGSSIRWQYLVAGFANLGSKNTHPDLFGVLLPAPEFDKLAQIPGAFRHLARDRAMNGYLMSFDVLQNPFIGGWLSADIVFGRQT